MIPLVFAGLCIPVVISNELSVFDDLDERLFHLPTIQRFATELPWPNLADYPSATTPLYHLLLAPIAALSGDSITLLRLFNLALSALCVWLAIRVLSRWGTPETAWPMALIMAASPYFVGPAVRLSTDNMALLGIIGALGALHPSTVQSPRNASIWVTVTVLTRQIHAWLLPLFLLRGLGPPRALRSWLSAALIPAAALVFFIIQWGGLTPPSFAKGHTAGLNLDVAVFALSILGVYSLGFIPWLRHGLETTRARQIAAGAAIACGAFLALHSMPWTDDPNRWGGAIWSASAHLPSVLDVPLPFWIGMPLGAVSLVAIAHHPRRKHGLFLVLAGVLWLGVNLVSARAYQKYYDPFCLFLLGAAAQGITVSRRAWIGPGLIAAALLAIDLLRFTN